MSGIKDINAVFNARITAFVNRCVITMGYVTIQLYISVADAVAKLSCTQ